MGWLFAAVGTALVLLTGTACTTATDDPPASSPAALEVDLAIDAVVTAEGAVTVAAETNLPDGTELGATLRASDGSFTAQDRQTVASGTVTFGPFSMRDEPLPPGHYDVDVTMPIARNQPDAVRAVIGEHGENLRGAAVGIEEITGDAVVSMSQVLTIE